METIGKFCVGVCLSVACGIVRAWCIVVMWGWFVLPHFVNAPHIGKATAYGLASLIGLMHVVSSPEYEDNSTTATVTRSITYSIVIPLITVGTCWFIK